MARATPLKTKLKDAVESRNIEELLWCIVSQSVDDIEKPEEDKLFTTVDFMSTIRQLVSINRAPRITQPEMFDAELEKFLIKPNQTVKKTL